MAHAALDLCIHCNQSPTTAACSLVSCLRPVATSYMCIRELDADKNHDILRELKKEVKETKELQRKWEIDKHRAEVDEDYRYHARQIVKAAEKLRKRLDLPLECVTELKEIERQREQEREKHKDIGRYLGEPKPVRDSSRPNSRSRYYREPPLNDRNRHSTRSDNYREPVASDRYRQGSRSDYPGEVHVLDTSREVLRLDYQRYPSKEKSSIEYQRSLQDFEPREDTEDGREAENNGFRDEMQRLLSENNGLKMALAENKKQQADLQWKLKEIEHKYHGSQQELAKNKEQFKENDKMTEKLIHQSEEYQKQIEGLQSSLQRYSNAEKEMKNIIDKLQSNLYVEQSLKEEALTRLSAFAGNELRDNNPGITDLSDPNRPMKLVEKVSELYDNEWTNAMENLEDLDIDEETGIKILLDLFMEVYTVCRDSGQSQLDPIPSGHYLVFPDIDDLRDITADVQLQRPDTDLSKPMKDYRKQYSEMADKYIAEVLKKRLDQKEGFTKEMVDACEKYLYSCVKYAWRMVVQDPPVYMEWQFNHGDQFDNNRLRSYTKGGKHVDFVVWPMLYLHKGGPLLSKGVAQGME